MATLDDRRSTEISTRVDALVARMLQEATTAAIAVALSEYGITLSEANAQAALSAEINDEATPAAITTAVTNEIDVRLAAVIPDEAP